MTDFIYIIIVHHQHGYDVLNGAYATSGEAHEAAEAWYREYMIGRGYPEAEIDKVLEGGEYLDEETYYDVHSVTPR